MRFKRYIVLFFAIGALVFFYSCSSEHKEIETVTYAEHIAPLIYKKCSNCHRPGEKCFVVNRLTYADFYSRRQLIKTVTKSRFMPPWPADASYTHFVDESINTGRNTIRTARWVDEGCVVGDSTKIPGVPNFPKALN